MDKGQAVAVRLLKRGHVFKWFVSGWSLKLVLWSPAPAWARNMYLLLHKLWAWFIFLFCLFFGTFLSLLLEEKQKPKTVTIPVVILSPTGFNLHHDVQDPLSEDTGHRHTSQLWRGERCSLNSLRESHHYRCCWISCCMWARLGPKLPAPLLAGHAPPHAARPRLPDGGEYRRSLWLHPLQGHLWCAYAHRPAGPAWQVTAPLLPLFFTSVAVICGTFWFYRRFFF